MPKGIRGFQKGQKFTEEHKQKMSIARRRLIMDPKNKDKKWIFKKGHKKYGGTPKGFKRSMEERQRMRLIRLGEKGSNWQGGKTSKHQRIRHSLEYRLWREAVFARDNYTCIWCGDNKGGNLNADHIKPFTLFPELRFSIDNGRTLCESCHKSTNTYGGKFGNKIK